MNSLRWFLLASGFFLLDLLTKIVAWKWLSSYTISVIPGFFHLGYTTNQGIAFSLFADQQHPLKLWLLTGIAVIAVGYIMWLHFRSPGLSFWGQLSLSMAVGGISGNAINRLWTGSVVDFLDFRFGTYSWPTFNLADTWITVGVVGLLLCMLKSSPSGELKI